MGYDNKTLRKHPGFNSAHNPDFGDRRIWVRHPKTGQNVVVGFRPRNPSRWVPHQSVRECERRRRQMHGAAQ